MAETMAVFLEACDVEARYKTISGKPVFSQSRLSTIRGRNKHNGLKPGDVGFEGPEYRKLGNRVYYPLGTTDRFVLGGEK